MSSRTPVAYHLPRPIRLQPYQPARLVHSRLAIPCQAFPTEPLQVSVLAPWARRSYEPLLRHQSCRRGFWFLGPGGGPESPRLCRCSAGTGRRPRTPHGRATRTARTSDGNTDHPHRRAQAAGDRYPIAYSSSITRHQVPESSTGVDVGRAIGRADVLRWILRRSRRASAGAAPRAPGPPSPARSSTERSFDSVDSSETLKPDTRQSARGRRVGTFTATKAAGKRTRTFTDSLEVDGKLVS